MQGARGAAPAPAPAQVQPQRHSISKFGGVSLHSSTRAGMCGWVIHSCSSARVQPHPRQQQPQRASYNHANSTRSQDAERALVLAAHGLLILLQRFLEVQHSVNSHE